MAAEAGRLIGYLALGLTVPVALILVALPIGAVLGVYPADFVTFSAFQEMVDAQMKSAGASELPIPIGILVGLQFINYWSGRSSIWFRRLCARRISLIQGLVYLGIKEIDS